MSNTRRQFATLLTCLLLLSSCTSKKSTEEVVISCAAVGRELELCQSGARIWSERSGVPVRVVTAPNNSSEQLANYQLILAAHSPDIDVFVIDTVWPGILGHFFIDMKPHLSREELAEHFPAFVDADMVKGKLVGIPWYIGAGLLYYRKDLLKKYGLEVPQTWQELTTSAEKIQNGERKAGNRNFWGFVFQGRAYEGLTCNALEWIHSFGGGTIADATGAVTINNPHAKEALTLAASWIGTITPRGALNYMEEEARGVFQTGNAAFLRNWPYAWALANAEGSPIQGKVGMTVLPAGGEKGRSTATLGGWSVSVSRFSQNQKHAISLAKYLAGKEEQKRRAIEAGLNPTIMSLYEDSDVLRANPSFKELFPVFKSAVPRPAQVTGSHYNRVSSEFWNAVHRVLSGEMKADQSLAELEKSLNRISQGGKWR